MRTTIGVLGLGRGVGLSRYRGLGSVFKGAVLEAFLVLLAPWLCLPVPNSRSAAHMVAGLNLDMEKLGKQASFALEAGRVGISSANLFCGGMLWERIWSRDG